MERNRKSALTLCLIGLCSTILAQGSERPMVPTLVATGEATVRVAPDEATIRLGIVAQAATAQKAQADANAVIQRFLASMDQLKVPKTAIQSSRISLNPVYSQPRQGEAPRVSGFQASSTLNIRLSDFGLIGDVVDAGVAVGVNTIEGISFGLRDGGKARTQALREAVREAREKAAAMAEAAGVALVSIRLIQEGGARVFPQPMDAAMFRGAAAPTAVEPGQVEVGASVTIEYIIRSG